MNRHKAKLSIKLDLGDRGQIEPWKIALLRAIDEHQSIAGAARALSMSYRRAWLPVNAVNKSLPFPAVYTKTGGRNRGGTYLTQSGRDLIQRYERIYEAATTAAARDLNF